MSDHPKFDRVFNVQSDLAEKTISVALGTAENTGFVFELSLPVVGALMGAVSAEAYRLNQQLPDEEKSDAATLEAHSVLLQPHADGRPMIILELKNGSLLPLIVSDADLAELSVGLARLASGDESKHN